MNGYFEWQFYFISRYREGVPRRDRYPNLVALNIKIQIRLRGWHEISFSIPGVLNLLLT